MERKVFAWRGREWKILEKLSSGRVSAAEIEDLRNELGESILNRIEGAIELDRVERDHERLLG